MARVILVLIVLALTIYAAVDLASTPRQDVRNAPKWLWAVIVICLPVIGPVSWLILGKPRPQTPGDTKTKRPPDDDDDFLRRLK